MSRRSESPPPPPPASCGKIIIVGRDGSPRNSILSGEDPQLSPSQGVEAQISLNSSSNGGTKGKTLKRKRPEVSQRSESLAQSPLEGASGSQSTPKKRKYEIPSVVETGHENDWTIQEELAEHFKITATHHMTKEQLKTAFMDENPVPTNILKVPQLDQTVEKALALNTVTTWVDGNFKKVNEGNKAKGRDAVMVDIAESHRNIMGPLGHIWSVLEDFVHDSKQDIAVEQDQESPDDEKIEKLESSLATYESVLNEIRNCVTCVAQTANKITHHRRVMAYSALPGATYELAKKEIVKCQDLFTDENKLLFGKSFTDDRVEDAKALKGLVENVQVNSDLKTLATGSSSNLNSTLFTKLARKSSGGRSSARGGQSTSRRGGNNARSYSSKSNYGSSTNYGSYYYGSNNYNNNGSKSGNRYNPDFSRGRKRKCTPTKPINKGFNIRTLKSIESFSPNSCARFTPRRKTENVPPKLEQGLQGQRNNKHHTRLGITLDGCPKTIQTTWTNKLLSERDSDHISRDRKDAGKGGNNTSETIPTSISLEYIHSREEGRRCQDNYQSEKPKQTPTISTLQDGGVEKPQEYAEERRSDGENRPSGRLLDCPNPPKLSEISEVPLARVTLPVHGDGLWPGAGSPDFHKDHESSNIHLEKTLDPGDYIPGRPATDRQLNGRNTDGQRHYIFPFKKPGIHDKCGQMYMDSISMLRLSGVPNQLSENGNIPPKGESRETDESVSEYSSEEENYSEETLSADRETECNISSCIRGPNPIEKPPTGPNTSPKREPFVRINNLSRQGQSPGDKMVDFKLERGTKSTDQHKTTTNDNRERCIQESLGGSLQRGNHSRRPLVPSGTTTPHKHIRAYSSRASSENFPQRGKEQASPHEDRQHNCPSLHNKERGDKVTIYESNHQKNMVIPDRAKYNPFRKLDTIKNECFSRCKVKGRTKLKRLAPTQRNLSEADQHLGCSLGRLLRIKKHASTSNLHESVSRSKLLSSRYDVPRLGKSFSLPISSLLLDRGLTKQADNGQRRQSNLDCPGVDNPALVSSAAGTNNSTTKATPTMEKPSKKSPGGEPSSSKIRENAVGCFSGHREALQSKGFSDAASILILSARRDSTTVSYSSYWRKWNTWCERKQINSYHANVRQISDFLALCFQEGYAYRTICMIRSAISAYHDPMGGRPVGEHPTIMKLLAGVKNLRPIPDKFPIIWDIDSVLHFLKRLGKTKKLSLKLLTWKTVMLIGLTAIPRASELVRLNLSRKSEGGNEVTFTFLNPHKHNRENKPSPDPLSIFKFNEDTDLCPVYCLKAYIKRTKFIRKGENRLFLATVKPHQAVTSETIGSWLKQILERVGVDTKLFKGHSIRKAASSKAKVRGATVQDIMDRGRWSYASTWEKFYHKKIISPQERFQNILLGGFTKDNK